MLVSFLNSGSKRNCTYCNVNGIHILIDVGMSMKQTNISLMVNYGIDLEDINIVIITHAHKDHISSLHAIANKYDNVKFLINKEVRERILVKTGKYLNKDKIIDFNGVLKGNKIDVYSFLLTHDEPCFGFKIIDKSNGEEYVHISDNGGHIKDDIINMITNATYYAIESNHDLTMQILDKNRNELLKRRVLGYWGHTHNADAIKNAIKLVGDNTKGVIFHHLSEECNTEELARETHDEWLSIWGERTKFKNINIKYARQGEMIELCQ